jgi:NAD(P)-dependent dehydrogenase (short-subunit alcohol dehydrogenase family)
MNSYNPFSLDGKTVLITGASSGIGQAAAIECSKLGAKVIITARNEERLGATLDSLEGDGHLSFPADLSHSEELDILVSGLPEIQGFVSNAGFTKLLPLPFIKENDLKDIFQVNTIAPMLLLQKLLKSKKIKKGGSVVFTSSMAGLGTVTYGNDMYSASKGALCAFVRNAALDLASKGIRVNTVCPGMVNTGILDSGTITKEQLNEDMKNYPLGRFGTPRDVALAMIYLLSDASDWVTGVNFVIDGGLTLK